MTVAEKTKRKLTSLKEAAELLKISQSQMKSDIFSGNCKAEKRKGRFEFEHEDVESYRRFLERRRGAKSKTAWRNAGRKLMPGAEAFEVRYHSVLNAGKTIEYAVYEESVTVPIRKLNLYPAVPRNIEDPASVASATFTVNRRAKRARDLSQDRYWKGRHGDAARYSEEKQRLYELKDRALAYIFRKFTGVGVSIHCNLFLFEFLGYSFHSTQGPESVFVDWQASEDHGCELNQPLLIASKPKGKNEMKLKDAVATLELLPDISVGEMGFASVSMATFPRDQWDNDFDQEDGEFLLR